MNSATERLATVRAHLEKLTELARQRQATEERGLLEAALLELDTLVLDAPAPASPDSGKTAVALREAQNTIRSVLGSLPVILWSITIEGTITLSEGAGLVGLGLAPGQLVGADVYHVYGEFPDAIEYIRRGLNGERFTVETAVDGRDWRNRYFPILDDSGRVVGLTGLSLDVTDSKRLEQETRRIEQQMQHAQKLESLGILTGGIAHDFNNLLVGILANATFAARNLPPDSPLVPRLRDIQNAAGRAAELTNQMLAYAGKARSAVETLDLESMISEMAHLLDAVLSKRASLRTEFGRDLPAIAGDATQVRQVIMNLLTNASDALGEQDGSIAVTTCVLEADRDYLSRCHLGEQLGAGRYVAVSVSDSGTGMDEETLKKIFDPFYTTKVDGRGLGLAAVIGIMRGHDGALRIDTKPDAGSTFTVLFPVSEEISSTQPAKPEDSSDLRGTGTILVVDDEPSVRDVIAAILEDAGFDVFKASNGRHAIALYDEHASDIVLTLLDMTMPGMDGDQTFRALRAMGSKLPIVLMSGHEDQVAIDRLVQQGPASFLSKPFSLDQLLQHVASAIQK